MKVKIIGTLAAAAVSVLLAGGMETSQVMADTVENTVSQEETYVQPRTSGLVWRYKVVNGKRYKRLYNTDTEKWVGNWIAC